MTTEKYTKKELMLLEQQIKTLKDAIKYLNDQLAPLNKKHFHLQKALNEAKNKRDKELANLAIVRVKEAIQVGDFIKVKSRSRQKIKMVKYIGPNSVNCADFYGIEPDKKNKTARKKYDDDIFFSLCGNINSYVFASIQGIYKWDTTTEKFNYISFRGQ